jgi:hypothetical protein
MVKWTKEEFKQATEMLAGWKSRLYLLEHKWEQVKRQKTYSEHREFDKVCTPLRRMIEEWDRKLHLNFAQNGKEE